MKSSAVNAREQPADQLHVERPASVNGSSSAAGQRWTGADALAPQLRVVAGNRRMSEAKVAKHRPR